MPIILSVALLKTFAKLLGYLFVPMVILVDDDDMMMKILV